MAGRLQSSLSHAMYFIAKGGFLSIDLGELCRVSLNIVESTVKEHVTSILERLSVRSRVELITSLRGRKVVKEIGSPPEALP